MPCFLSSTTSVLLQFYRVICSNAKLSTNPKHGDEVTPAAYLSVCHNHSVWNLSALHLACSLLHHSLQNCVLRLIFIDGELGNHSSAMSVRAFFHKHKAQESTHTHTHTHTHSNKKTEQSVLARAYSFTDRHIIQTYMHTEYAPLKT
jgi:hypothetical protein